MIQEFRFQGDDFADVKDMTQPDCVPSLQIIVERVLAGAGTGLGDSVYDESDTDFNMMDRLDREAMRQETDRRITLAEEEELKKKNVDEKKEEPDVSPETPSDDIPSE